MRFAYHDMSCDQFEKLIICLCQRILGAGVQGFTKGRDGGRDAKFMGTAELYPSKASPWVGITIVQAKHTNGYNSSFSDKEFFSEKSSSTILSREIPSIQRLRREQQLDNYMLFSNRRLTAGTEETICKHISDTCNIPRPSVCLCGVEQIEMWLKTYPKVVEDAELDPIDSPLIVRSDDIAEVVEAFARNKNVLEKALLSPPTERTTYEEKNKINRMTPEYAKAMRQKYLAETYQIQNFLSAPENLSLQSQYNLAVEDFNFKIISKRKNYQSFDEIIEYLIDLLSKRDATLRQSSHKPLMRAMLFYMYWNCDIGEKK